MSYRALNIVAGAVARERLAERGWDPDIFSLLLGASGGPKWLVTSQTDRLLFGDFLARRETPIHVLGTSIGSWRHACLAQDDPRAALERLEAAYIGQRYDSRPTIDEITEVSESIRDEMLGTDGARQIVENPRIHTHIGTVRGRGPAASRRKLVQGSALGLAMVSNLASRRLLQLWYQRVIFSSADASRGIGMAFDDFSTLHTRLTVENLPRALIASGSIPLVLEGVQDPPGAPPGQYWDGGVVDYHHDLALYRGDGLVLYPHFYDHVIPGWFDKALKRRWARGSLLDRVVIVAPSRDFVRALPGAKIPDRTDFETLGSDERIERWWQVVERCRILAEELDQVLQQADPLEGVASFEGRD